MKTLGSWCIRIILVMASVGLASAGSFNTLANAMPNRATPMSTAMGSNSAQFIEVIGGVLGVKRSHLNASDNQSNKWIRLCKEKQDCSSADDDIARRYTFRA